MKQHINKNGIYIYQDFNGFLLRCHLSNDYIIERAYTSACEFVITEVTPSDLLLR